ncbi:MAG: C40 family peptidase [Butyrivibrio sp.]|nr:C40 family peptidase [Butyrivibrio sp.]
MTVSVVAAITFSSLDSVNVYASPSSRKVTSVLPQAGFSYALGDNQVSLSNLQKSINEDGAESGASKGASKGASNKGTSNKEASSAVSKSAAELSSTDAVTDMAPSANDITANILHDIEEATGVVIGEREKQREAEAAEEEERIKGLVIAKCSSSESWVNVRDSASEEGEIVGYLPDSCVGTLVGEEDGWYQIKSKDVEGYVKAEFCVTGDEAVEHAKEAGTRMATVTGETVYLREGPSLDDKVLNNSRKGEDFVVVEELGDWVRISSEDGDLYISRDYVKIETKFNEAETKAQREAREAKEKAEQEANRKAASKGTSNKTESKGDKQYKSAASYTSQSSSIGSAVAQYACQFVGNPYVYGGTSLTNGADCSGFVMSVYANFGVSLPHSSSADRSVGAAVDGLANAQPGDIVCYSGHVAIYIGNGQIVHASTAKTGIKISNANYRSVLAVRRIL